MTKACVVEPAVFRSDHLAGPKAGGPHYLFRFALERTLSVDTTAAGGNGTYTYTWDLDNNGSYETAGQTVAQVRAALEGATLEAWRR